MKRFAIFSVFVLLASLGYAQNCGTISDEAGKISNAAAVTQGASALSNQGVDAHVITVTSFAKYGGRAEGVLNVYLRNCRTWSTASGRRNANLLVTVFAFSPKLTGETFYGAAYDGVFKNNGKASSILVTSAGPYFKTQQYGEGIGQAFKGYASAIASAHQLPIPIQSTTIINHNQATTDPKTAAANASVWKWFFILLFLAVVGTIVFLILRHRLLHRQLTLRQRLMRL